jgi:predicted transcriptional regulator
MSRIFYVISREIAKIHTKRKSLESFSELGTNSVVDRTLAELDDELEDLLDELILEYHADKQCKSLEVNKDKVGSDDIPRSGNVTKSGDDGPDPTLSDL